MQQQDISEATTQLHHDAETLFERNKVERNGAAPGHPFAKEGDAEATPGERSELESNYPSASDETQCTGEEGEGGQQESCWHNRRRKLLLSFLQQS